MSPRPGAHNPSGAIHPTRFLLGWGLATLLLSYLAPVGLPLAPSVASLVAKILLVPAAILLLWSQYSFWRAGTTTDHTQDTTTLVTSGPFRLSRNPVYVGLLLLMVGLGLRYDTLWAILLALPVAAALRQWTVLPEERYLGDRFGEPYQAYKDQVRRWI